MRVFFVLLCIGMASTSYAGFGDYNESTDYVNYCTGQHCIKGPVTLSQVSWDHLEHINGVIDRLEMLEAIRIYVSPVFSIINAREVRDQLDYIADFVKNKDWESEFDDYTFRIPTYKFATLIKELNFVLYDVLKKNLPSTDREFWKKFKLITMKALDRVNGVPECAGVYCSNMEAGRIDCTLTLRKPKDGWKARICLEKCNRGNIINVDDPDFVNMDLNDGTVEIINPKEGRNTFLGEFDDDKKSMKFSSYFKQTKMWKLKLIKKE